MVRNRCCLCDSREKPFKYELRPTGPGGVLQPWPYCSACYSELVGELKKEES